jgi:cob(I)alamin adenosyltransferase
MTEKPRILIFTGPGKGKTTAALGMVLRASGHGLRSKIVQFLKSDKVSGETTALQHLPGVEFVRRGLGFVPKQQDDPRFAEHRRTAEEGLELAREAILSDTYDLVVLDEICGAVASGLLEDEKVIELLKQAPARLRLALTGRRAPAALIELADTVTEMRCVKHDLQQGRTAQPGVEF